MTDDLVIAALNDFQALWLTIWAEARAELVEGQIAVACVIRNRVLADLGDDDKPDWWGEGYRGVCLKPSQFSCWNPGTDRNHLAVMRLARIEIGDYAERSALPRDPVVEQVKWVAEGVVGDMVLDRTSGATHYLTRALFYSRNVPNWARGRQLLAAIGNHVFLKV